MDEDEQEDEYSSEYSGESFTIEVRDVPKVLHTSATRAAEFTEKMKGRVHQSHIPSWRFEGRQGSLSGFKRDETKPVDRADESPALAALVGVSMESSRQQMYKSMKDLWCCILRLCFRELAIVSGDQWERNMRLYHHW